MYLEISGRRSGKTYRLAKAMIEYLYSTDKDVYYCTFNWAVYSGFIDLYIPKVMRHRVLFLTKSNIDDLDSMRFYDEFDWPNTTRLLQYNSNWYYVTTPYKMRSAEDFENKNDFLIKLLECNNWCYTVCINRDILDNVALKNSYEYTKYKTEILGKWIKG